MLDMQIDYNACSSQQQKSAVLFIPSKKLVYSKLSFAHTSPVCNSLSYMYLIPLLQNKSQPST